MRWSSILPLLLAGNAFAAGGFVIGLGAEGDSADGLAGTVAYRGDSDVLDSRDRRASLYWRGERAMLSGDYEYRDFEFDLPSTDRFSGGTVDFDANGVGLSTRFDLTDNLSLRAYVALGLDDSDLHGDVTFFSVFPYFYGGT